MAENLDTPSFGAFSIENTFEMGAGNQELLNDLIAPETASSTPDEVKPIEEEAPKATAPSKATPSKETPPQEDEKVKSQETLANFLLGDDDDAEEEEEETPAPQAAKKPTTSEEAPAQEESSEEEEVSKFAALSKDLFKLGVFTQGEDDEEELNISTPEEFLERFHAEKKKGAVEIVNNFIGQFGEDYQQAFDAIFVKGINPKDYFGVYNNVVNFSEMDLSDENNQMTVIRQALTDQGFEPEDVSTEIERLKNYGDLETVATKHHKVLVKKEAAKLQQMERQAEIELQQKQAIKQQYFNNVQVVLQEKLKSKEFDGIPINPKLANELQDFLLVDKYKTSSGETLTEFDKTILDLKRPENHQMKVKVALLLKVLEKDPTLSTIQKTGVSKKANELFSEVVRHKDKSKSSSTSSSSKPQSWFV